MSKIFNKILLGVLMVFLFAGTGFAANTTSVRLQQPQSPTDKSSFDITFVALDLNNSSVSVQCFKKGPSDGSFVAFGSAVSLAAGGNTANCSVDSSVINATGTYQFYVVATGSNTATSNTVSVDYNTPTNPGKPENYNKTKPDNCTYKITFTSANDSGRTVKIVLYRSDATSFNTDSGHQVNSINIGSNTDGSMSDNISPNCNTTYYYAIRAYDVYGNGSDPVGDESITTNTVIVNPTTTTIQEAIPVGGQGGAGGSVLGAGAEEPGKEVLSATEAASPTPEIINIGGQNPVSGAMSWILTHKKISLLVIIVLAAIGYGIYLVRPKKVE